jgi:glycosyltransferase involved in cell wall biosynthesis
MFLGRIYPVKGLLMLVEAWARTCPRGWRLVIAGPDEAGHLAQVQKKVVGAGLQDVISFPGPMHGKAKTAALYAAELFILPSHSESFGMAVAEALAHEVPVLTTTAVPWPQLTECGCGWRVAPTPEGLAEGLRQATTCGSTTLRAMGGVGRNLIAEDFGWPQVAADFRALYGAVVDQRGAGPFA